MCGQANMRLGHTMGARAALNCLSQERVSYDVVAGGTSGAEFTLGRHSFDILQGSSVT